MFVCDNAFGLGKVADRSGTGVIQRYICKVFNVADRGTGGGKLAAADKSFGLAVSGSYRLILFGLDGESFFDCAVKIAFGIHPAEVSAFSLGDILQCNSGKTFDIADRGAGGLERTGRGSGLRYRYLAGDGVFSIDGVFAPGFLAGQVGYIAGGSFYHCYIAVTGYGIGSTLTTGIKLGLAFINGSDFYEIDPVTITAVDAIFLFTDGEEVLTNADDAENKAN